MCIGVLLKFWQFNLLMDSDLFILITFADENKFFVKISKIQDIFQYNESL